jgi:exopolysaccharide production protein ExoZ
MSQSLAKIRNLQVLRAYAALAVVLFHTNCTPPGIHPMGLFGVHLFFLLSGYVMASICENDTRAFVRRRLIRIIPLYWTLTLLVYLAAWKAPHLMNTTRAIPSELLKSLFFVPFLKSNGLYQPVLFVGWSVNYEMFFYMMLSIALLIHKRRAAVLGSAIMLCVMATCSPFAKTSAVANFYSNSILFECILGVAAYYCVRAVSRQLAPTSRPVLITMAIASLVLLPAIEGFSVLASMPMVVRFGPLCFVLICSASLLAISGADMGAGTLVLLGDASYVIYLVHPFIETFLNRVVGRLNPMFHIDSPIGCLIAVSFVLLISMFLYLKVDKPSVVYLNRVLCGRQRQDTVIVTTPAAVAPVGTAA